MAPTSTKPYKLIWWFIPIILVLSGLDYSAVIEVNFLNLYFVATSLQIGIVSSIILGVLGFIYWKARHIKLVNWITNIYIVFTLMSFISILCIALFLSKNCSQQDFETYRLINQLLLLSIWIATLSQLIFIINLIYSMIRNDKKE